MSENNDSTIIDEAEIVSDKPAAKKEKNHLLLYLFLALFVAVGGWAAFNPDIVLNLKDRIQSYQDQASTSSEESAEIVTQELPEQATEDTAEPDEPDTPIFQPAEELSTMPEEDEAATAELIPYSDLNSLNSTVQELQQQIIELQHTINVMHTQQLEQSQRMISAQLFALLQQAALPQPDLIKAATVWKSISFLPLLSDEKRAAALQGHEALKRLHYDIQATSDEITAIISTLSKQLEPEELAQIEVSEDVSDPYQEVVESTWMDWLMAQFKITKVDPETLVTPEDPYADTKRLITELKQLQSAVRLSRWQSISSLNKLFYELEQRGIENSLSHELIRGYEQTELNWQNQAQSWMEQL